MTTQPDALTAEDAQRLVEIWSQMHPYGDDGTFQLSVIGFEESQRVWQAWNALPRLADALTTATQERKRALAERDALRGRIAALEGRLGGLEAMIYSLQRETRPDDLWMGREMMLDAIAESLGHASLASPPAPSAGRETGD